MDSKDNTSKGYGINNMSKTYLEKEGLSTFAISESSFSI